ncbi:MAG: radical SAM family heme chaperone HemW [Corynebacterium sp.]|nr:radical SAM family heme chaperone HemW [Corynebacterium sp.]
MTTPFGVYIHVPFCASRCGYCDFNTYTPGELGTATSPAEYLIALRQELELAAASGMTRSADTVFIGGGTPSMLGAELVTVLDMVRETIGISAGAEVTTESNPESTSLPLFESLLEGGFTRISLGMQSAAPHILQILERRHTPGRAIAAAQEAYDAGFRHINLDMIYGTPGESEADVRSTLDAILSVPVDHVSAYSLIVEDGTAMARKVRRGEIPVPDEDIHADRYVLIDETLRAAGFDWYEVSNWARPGGECQHNLGYWRDGDWWGAGPGAHSHLKNVRFYNVKHPAKYATICGNGTLPIEATEDLSDQDRHVERIMLGLRLKEGIPRDLIGASAEEVVQGYIRQGLLKEFGSGGAGGVFEAGGAGGGGGVCVRLGLTEAGRLLADGIVADILLAEES